MVLVLDNPPAHLPSHSSTNLLLCTTLPFTDKPVPTLVNSSATNNFIDESLVALAPQPLRRLPAPIPLKLFDGDSTPAGDITHCLETTMTFADGQQQELQLLVTKLHPSAPVVLGLTLHLDRDNPTNSGLVPFNVSPPSKNSETTIDQLWTPLQLHSRSAWSFIIYVRLGGSLKVLPALVDSGASSVFGPHYPDQQCPKPPTDPNITPDPTITPTVPNPVDPRDLNIKIISTVPFTRLLREGTPTFQLQVMPALPEEYLCAGTTAPESKMEEQILSEVVPPEYHEFADMFSEGSAKELPPHRSYDHKIDLEEGTSPPFGKIYNMSEIELWALKKYLNDMLSKGFICLSISAAGAPVLFAKKKDGSLRLCVDYWGLNKVTKKNRYPLPLIRDLVDHLCSAKIYTKIDLHSGYNNVWIAPEHEWKTAFCTRYGLFEYLIMPFRMANSPATFQYFMNDIFHDMNNVFVIVYLDNILIYSNSLAEHLEHIRHVLERLQEYHLHAKPKKCSFHTMEVKYLGVILTPDGVRMDPAKVDTILNWPSPRNIKEVQSFLGFANFYRRFIDNYSGITKPLNRLTWKDTPWDWDSKCQSIFLLLKKAFTSAPVLCHFDPSLLIMLKCDASDYTIAGILSQSDSGGKDLHPVAFYT
ncbi:hypothetical protein E4T56_gene20776 [Termitomyces sp. T112]|nr:hypothetical protein E4T56_gene20776 [Termitomyces sp. T112]